MSRAGVAGLAQTTASAWDALTAALSIQPPPCTGDDRFTADTRTAGDLVQLGAICERCAAFRECLEYAEQAERSRGAYGVTLVGFWSGSERGRGA